MPVDAAEPLLLLPPSEGKAGGGSGRHRPGAGAFGVLAGERAQVLDALVAALDAADEAGASRLLGVRGALLERALGAVAELRAGAAPVLPAARRYTGVVWDHLGAATLDEAALARIVVPSALLGLVTGADPVPDHRLKLTVSLPGLGRLARWWRPALTEALGAAAGGRPLVDLLPGEHAAALDLAALGRTSAVVRVRFRTAGGAGTAGHAAKAVKGMVARTVLEGGLGALDGFTWEGWRARPAAGGVDVVAPG